MNKRQEKLLAVIQGNGRLLTEEEMIQFYADNVQRKYCPVSMFAEVKYKRGYDYEDVKTMARNFYTRAIGSAVMAGRLKVDVNSLCT